ncbi:hypothetical protein PUN28_020681 [Cardiocondyla obscurior]|uniref:Uncharacterized protein n=1 Tax=Cardiocondyla obscurior TaxID=286306 RepID=A0AAW2E6U6_9HYME
MCVRNVDVHVSCSSQVDAQLAAFFIDPRANYGTIMEREGDVGCRRGAKTKRLRYHRYAAHSRAPQRVRIAEIEAARERASWRRVSAHAVVASHKLFSPLDLAILLERSVASRDGRSDEEWEGGADSEDAIVARVRPRTSKGITDLLLLNLVRLEAACPSKKICLYVGSKNPPAEAGAFEYHKFQLCNHTFPGTQKLWFPGSCPPSHRRNFGGSLAGIVYAGITAAAGTRLALNGSSLKDLKCTHSDYGASDESRIVIFPVSQAPSPESNPDSPLPVTTMVGAEPTIDRRAVRVSCVVNAAGTFRAVRATYEPFGLSTPTRGNAVSYSTEPGGRAVGDARSNARRYMGETCEISTPRGLSRCVVRSYLRKSPRASCCFRQVVTHGQLERQSTRAPYLRTTLLYAPQCFVELGYTYAVTLRYDQT